MPLIFLVLFIAVPVIEIGVFIQVGGLIGLWPTLAIVLLTAVAGTALLKQQGLAVMRRAQDSLNRGEMPLREVFDGACLLFAGALLLTPASSPTPRAWRCSCRRSVMRCGGRSYRRWSSVERCITAPTYTNNSGHHQYRDGGPGPFGQDGPAKPGGVTEIEGDYREVTPGEERPDDEPPPDDMPPRPGPPRE